VLSDPKNGEGGKREVKKKEEATVVQVHCHATCPPSKGGGKKGEEEGWLRVARIDPKRENKRREAFPWDFARVKRKRREKGGKKRRLYKPIEGKG